MAKTKKEKNVPYIEIVFGNNLTPERYREYQERVISANLKEQIPAHLQEQLIDKFVEAGLMVQ